MNALEMNFFIAIRQDFYGNLGDFWDVPEFNTESYHHYLKTLGEEEAIAAIEKPITKIPDKIGYEDNFVEQTLLPDLIQSSETDNHQQINPVHLQIVCNSLFEEARKNNASAIETGKIVTIGQELYDELNKVAGILQGYVTKILDDKAKFTFDERTIAKYLLQQMVTSQETRIFCSFDDLTEKLDYPPKQIKSIIKKLDDSRLIETKQENDHTAYSITHEYLAKQVNKWYDPKELEIKRVKEIWARCLDNWHDSSHTITIPRNQYKDIKKFESYLQLDKKGQSLIKKSSIKYWGFKIGIFIGISSLVGLTVLSINGYRNATINQIRASIQASEANFNLNQNLQSLMEAIRAAKTIKESPIIKFGKLEPEIKKVLFQGLKRLTDNRKLSSLNYQSKISNLNISNDGNYLVGGLNNKIHIWDKYGKTLNSNLELEFYWGNYTEISPYNNFFILYNIVDPNYSTYILNMEGEILYELPLKSYQDDGLQNEFRNLIINQNEENESYIYLCSSRALMILKYNQDKVTEIRRFETKEDEYIDSCQLASPQYFSVEIYNLNTEDSKMTVWNQFEENFENDTFADSSERRKKMNDTYHPIKDEYKITYSPDKKYVILSNETQAELWSNEGDLLANLDHEVKYSFKTPKFIFEDNIVATYVNSGAKLWQSNGDFIAELTHLDLNGLLFNDKHNYIITKGKKDIKLWNKKGELVTSLIPKNEINDVIVSPNGDYVYGVSDEEITIWRLKEYRFSKTVTHKEQINSVRFSSDGEKIITSSLDKTVIIWNRQNDEFKQQLDPLIHSNTVFDAKFSPQNNYILTESGKEVKLWFKDGSEIGTLKRKSKYSINEYNNQFLSEFSDDEKYIVTSESQENYESLSTVIWGT